MIAAEKIKAVQLELKKGIPEGEIKNKLLSEGYTPEDIEEAFKPVQHDMRSWYLVSAIILMLIGIYIAATHGGMIVLVFSAIMYSVYYNEVQKFKKGKAIK